MSPHGQRLHKTKYCAGLNASNRVVWKTVCGCEFCSRTMASASIFDEPFVVERVLLHCVGCPDIGNPGRDTKTDKLSDNPVNKLRTWCRICGF